MSDLDSLAFEPGQQVQCKTRYDDIYKGEVVAFDLNSKILILKSPSSQSNNNNNNNVSSTTGGSSSTNHDLHCLVLDSVSEVEILEEVPKGKTINDLPNLDPKYISAKREAASKERYCLVKAVENGVSLDGINLYTTFCKTYRAADVTWKDNVRIVVMNSVVISPPYKESDCEPLTSKTTKAVPYVKSFVKKYWESKQKQQQQIETAPAAPTSTTSTVVQPAK